MWAICVHKPCTIMHYWTFVAGADSDRGVQYCSGSYQCLLSANNLICSMSSVGCCYDNAAMESFFHTLKVEVSAR